MGNTLAVVQAFVYKNYLVIAGVVIAILLWYFLVYKKAHPRSEPVYIKRFPAFTVTPTEVDPNDHRA